MLGSLLKDDPNTALVMFDSDHRGAVKDLFLQTIGEGASWLLRHPKMMGRIGCTSGGGVQGLCSLAKHRLSSNRFRQNTSEWSRKVSRWAARRALPSGRRELRREKATSIGSGA